MEGQEKKCCMDNQENGCCMGKRRMCRKWIIIKVIILIVGIVIGLAIGMHHNRGVRGFENGGFGMQGNAIVAQRGGMMRNNLPQRNLEKVATGDQAALRTQMTQIAALQDNYTSMLNFIQRGDTANAGQRIDQLMAELAQLKIDLPKGVTSLTK